ncbi:MAG: DinB family protein [Bellilinea sp.]
MSLTVLFDLDDTLLGNEIQPFIQRYFQLLGKSIQSYAEPQQFMRAMNTAVLAMLEKRTPIHTLEEAFDTSFYCGIGVSKADLRPVIENFYRNTFPQLRSLTVRHAQAVELICAVFAQGWQVVIATNPLFPRTAIEQRLEWAGLPVDQFKYTKITSFENSHFCKPNPAYYAEILAELRWQQQPAVMVGNSLEDDILPAEQLGMPTFWLCANSQPDTRVERHPLSRTGSLGQVLPWLKDIHSIGQPPSFDSHPAILATLQSTPAAIDSFSRTLPHNLWNRRPTPKEWSLTEIICHLRDVDRDVNLDRIEAVLSGSRPFLQAALTDGWVEERNCAQEDGRVSLDEFMQVRCALLDKLIPLSEADWQAAARHAIFGPTTLKELVSFIATHDRIHVNQVWDAIQAVS